MTDKTTAVNDAIEAVNSIPKFIDAITELLNTPYGWIALAAVLVWIFLNKNLISIFLEPNKKEIHKIERLDSYVENPEAADKLTLQAIKDLRDAHYFKIATGIYAEKNLREALIKLHNKHSPTINWTHIKRALPYIETNKGTETSVRKTTISETIGYYYNLSTGILFLFLSIAALVAFISTGKLNLISVLTGAGSALFSFAFALFVFSQNFPEKSAKLIRNTIKKLKE